MPHVPNRAARLLCALACVLFGDDARAARPQFDRSLSVLQSGGLQLAARGEGLLQQGGLEDADSAAEGTPARMGKMKYAYPEDGSTGKLSLEEGDIVAVLDNTAEGWTWVSVLRSKTPRGVKGWIPKTYWEDWKEPERGSGGAAKADKAEFKTGETLLAMQPIHCVEATSKAGAVVNEGDVGTITHVAKEGAGIDSVSIVFKLQGAVVVGAADFDKLWDVEDTTAYKKHAVIDVELDDRSWRRGRVWNVAQDPQDPRTRLVSVDYPSLAGFSYTGSSKWETATKTFKVTDDVEPQGVRWPSQVDYKIE